MIISLLTVGFSIGCFFATAWVFLVEKLSAEYRVDRNAVKLLFAMMFSASSLLFELFIFEILNLFDSGYVHLILMTRLSSQNAVVLLAPGDLFFFGPGRSRHPSISVLFAGTIAKQWYLNVYYVL